MPLNESPDYFREVVDTVLGANHAQPLLAEIQDIKVPDMSDTWGNIGNLRIAYGRDGLNRRLSISGAHYMRVVHSYDPDHPETLTSRLVIGENSGEPDNMLRDRYDIMDDAFADFELPTHRQQRIAVFASVPMQRLVDLPELMLTTHPEARSFFDTYHAKAK